MKKYILLLFISVNLLNCKAQEVNQIVFDEKAKQDILQGTCNRDGFYLDQFRNWFDEEYDRYSLDMNTLQKIDSDIFNNYKITIVLGTWCSDSRREVPRMYKILDEFGFDEDQLEVICVNRNKQAEGFDIENLNIELIPTFIFYYNEQEKGRIIESPKISLEKDIEQIM